VLVASMRAVGLIIAEEAALSPTTIERPVWLVWVRDCKCMSAPASSKTGINRNHARS
jgi:hypothetical protein